MNVGKLAIGFTVFGLWAFPAFAVTVSPADAPDHVGEIATVCGMSQLTR